MIADSTRIGVVTQDWERHRHNIYTKIAVHLPHVLAEVVMQYTSCPLDRFFNVISRTQPRAILDIAAVGHVITANLDHYWDSSFMIMAAVHGTMRSSRKVIYGPALMSALDHLPTLQTLFIPLVVNHLGKMANDYQADYARLFCNDIAEQLINSYRSTAESLTEVDPSAKKAV